MAVLAEIRQLAIIMFLPTPDLIRLDKTLLSIMVPDLEPAIGRGAWLGIRFSA